MRAFVAINLPPLPGPLPAWIRPEDHLTLQFFEDLAVERAGGVIESMTVAAQATPPFDLEVRGVGAFPTVQRPRVVWAGVGEGGPVLESLVARLRQDLAGRGFLIERRSFVPHLTLRRLRSEREVNEARRFLMDPENAARPWVRARISEILLKESELLPTGARHSTRERVALGSPEPATQVRVGNF